MNLPDDPWELLGLSRAEATERDVKRAYARLLKLHRPDADPEGFQKLHAAYQWALAALSRPERSAGFPGMAGPDFSEKSVRESAPEDGAAAGPTEPDGASVELPENFITAAEGLRAERTGESASGKTSWHFNVLRNVVRSTPGLEKSWAGVLRECFPNAHQYASNLDAEDVYRLANAGEVHLAIEIMHAWGAVDACRMQLTAMAKLVIQRGLPSHPEALPAVLHFLARVTAFSQPDVAGNLANALYRVLGKGERETVIREIETRMMAGRSFARFNPEQRRFWESAVFDFHRHPDFWESAEGTEALSRLVLLCGPDWEGWHLIAHAVPRDVIDAWFRKFAARRKVTVRKVKPAAMTLRILLIITMLCIALGGAVESCKSDRPSRSSRNRPFSETIRIPEEALRSMKFDLPESPAYRFPRRWPNPLLKPPGSASGPGDPLVPESKPPTNRPAPGIDDLRYDPRVAPDKPDSDIRLWDDTPAKR